MFFLPPCPLAFLVHVGTYFQSSFQAECWHLYDALCLYMREIFSWWNHTQWWAQLRLVMVGFVSWWGKHNHREPWKPFTQKSTYCSISQVRVCAQENVVLPARIAARVQTGATANCGESGPMPQVGDGTWSVLLPWLEEVSIHSVTAAQGYLCPSITSVVKTHSTSVPAVTRHPPHALDSLRVSLLPCASQIPAKLFPEACFQKRPPSPPCPIHCFVWSLQNVAFLSK